MKFSVTGLFGLFVASTLGAPNAQPLYSDGFPIVEARQTDFIEYADVTSRKYPLSFTFYTKEQDDRNWIGIWPAGRGPSDGKSSENSALWDWVHGGAIQKTIWPGGLASGDYEAYLLLGEGYEKLAGPAKFHWKGFSGTSGIGARDDVSFIPTSAITLANARVGDKYEYNVTGLLRNPTDLAFSVKGDSWVTINDEGLLSGTPKSAGDTQFSVIASAGGASSELFITIPVVDKDKNLVSELSVMTYNLWEKGEHVNDHHAKQVAFLAEADVDIVGLQETDPQRTKELADALWWWFYAEGDRTGIMSRYPITAESLVDAGISVTVSLTDSNVQLWNVHLSPDDYGPYNVCFNKNSTEEVIAVEKEQRGGEIKQAVADVKKWESTAPVVLVGDFNAPSHLDWIKETSDDHCGAGAIKWPSSDEPFRQGLKDAYREIYPDPKKDPGNTWSPLWDMQEEGKEPQDRIDFIYFNEEDLKVQRAETLMVGKPRLHGNHQDNLWTSDHKAVKAVFDIL